MNLRARRVPGRLLELGAKSVTALIRVSALPLMRPVRKAALELVGIVKGAAMVKLTELTIIHAPIERCFDLARSVEVHLAGNLHFGEAAIAAGGVTAGLIGLGERVTWQARHLGVRQRLTSEITAMERPRYFQDRMIRGTFSFLTHDHVFRSISGDETEMTDVFCFAAPLGFLGQLAEIAVLRRYMRSLLQERNGVLKQIAESSAWRNYLR